LCGEIILELCTNAIKHGKARNISVQIELVSERIASLIVANDGEGLKLETTGSGSQLLKQSCLSTDQFDAEGTTVVTVTVPFSVTENL
jgi:two-component sensor histidine kinase